MRLWAFFVLLVEVAILTGMIAFIVGRRVWRRLSFRLSDRYRELWLRVLPELLAGDTPARWELARPEARETFEALVIDRLHTGEGEEREKIVALIERAGLVERRVEMLRHGPRWERLQSAALLGELQAELAVPALLEALNDEWPVLRIAVVRSLAAIGSPRAGRPLVASALTHLPTEPAVFLEAAIACVADPAEFLPMLADGRPQMRALGARALAESPHAPSFDLLNPLAFDPDAEVRAQVVRALARAKDARALPLLVSAANDDSWFVRLRAVVALAERGDSAGLSAILQATCDRNFRVRQRACAGLAAMVVNPARILPAVLRMRDRYSTEGYGSQLARAGLLWRTLPLLRSPDAAQRRAAIEFLTWAISIGHHHEVLYAIEAHPEWRLRFSAARLLESAGSDALATVVREHAAAAGNVRTRKVLEIVSRRLSERVAPPPQPSLARAASAG